MDVPLFMSAHVEGGREVLSTDAYAQFWDCLENDIPVGVDSPPSDDVTDAYLQYWQQTDL